MIVGNSTKAFCQCKQPENAYYGLIGPGETKPPPRIQWVHICGKPTKAVWRFWIRKCQVCWTGFSSPWSVLCKSCHAEEHGTGVTFKGWAWARMHDDEYRKKLLDAGTRLRYAQEVEGRTALAPEAPQL